VTDTEYEARRAWLKQHKKRKRESPPADQPHEGAQ